MSEKVSKDEQDAIFKIYTSLQKNFSDIERQFQADRLRFFQRISLNSKSMLMIEKYICVFHLNLDLWTKDITEAYLEIENAIS